MSMDVPLLRAMLEHHALASVRAALAQRLIRRQSRLDASVEGAAEDALGHRVRRDSGRVGEEGREPGGLLCAVRRELHVSVMLTGEVGSVSEDSLAAHG